MPRPFGATGFWIDKNIFAGGINMDKASQAREHVERVAASFAVDGMILDDEQKDGLMRIALGEITHEESIEELDRKYKKVASESA